MVDCVTQFWRYHLAGYVGRSVGSKMSNQQENVWVKLKCWIKIYCCDEQIHHFLALKSLVHYFNWAKM